MLDPEAYFLIKQRMSCLDHVIQKTYYCLLYLLLIILVFSRVRLQVKLRLHVKRKVIIKYII